MLARVKRERPSRVARRRHDSRSGRSRSACEANQAEAGQHIPQEPQGPQRLRQQLGRATQRDRVHRIGRRRQQADGVVEAATADRIHQQDRAGPDETMRDAHHIVAVPEDRVESGPHQGCPGRAKGREMVLIGDVGARAPVTAALGDVPGIGVVFLVIRAGRGRGVQTQRDRQAQAKGKAGHEHRQQIHRLPVGTIHRWHSSSVAPDQDDSTSPDPGVGADDDPSRPAA